MAKASKVFDFGPLSTRAALGTIDREKRTAEVVFTTGERVLRESFWDGPFYEELSTDPGAVRLGRLNSGAPFLPDHRSGVSGQLGVVENARIEDGKGIATIRFAAAGIDPEADKVFGKIADGIVRNVSVGYRTHRAVEVENGDSTIPVLRAVDWEPYEISAVSMGADSAAHFRSGELQSNQCVIESARYEVEKMEPKDQKVEEVKAPAQETRSVDLVAVAKEGAEKERTRAKDIRHAVRVAKLGDEFADKLINDGTEIGDARAAVIDELAKRGAATEIHPQHSITVGVTASEKRAEGVEAALLARAGMLAMVNEAAKKFPELIKAVNGDGREFRGMSLFDHTREALELAGVRTRGLDRMDLVGRSFSRRASGLTSSSDFPVIMESALHKVLQARYLLADPVWRKFCGVKPVSDFRDHKFYRMGMMGVLPALGEHGEYEHAGIDDGESVAVSVGTYGQIIGLTRKAVINDDLGALSDLAGQQGLAAALTIEEAVFDLLALNGGLGPTCDDSVVFFDADHSNISTGAALSIEALDADAAKMEAQRDSNDKQYLALRPSVLLVPRALKGTAIVAVTAEYNNDSEFQKPNFIRGMIPEANVIASPRISGTRRYMFADPSGPAPAFVVSFLEGQQAPVLDQKAGWDVDGTEWRVRLDFGVDPFDPKGAITNAGT